MFDNSYYILIGKNPVAIPRDQFMEWGRWFEWNANNGSRHVGSLHIPPRKPLRKGNSNMLRKINRQRSEAIFVSTVFLGLNHNHFNNYGTAPIVFETMIFGGEHDQFQRRYFTWDEAKEGHDLAVGLAITGMAL